MLAHRGLALEAPENTLLSFVAALGLGITHLETDVHASRDGVAVISHDPELARVASRPGRVIELSMAELRDVDLGHGQGFCSLAEALDAFPEARFNIDIKAASAIQPTVDAVRAARATDRVLLTSFSESRRRAAVRLLPGVATSASGPRFAAALAAGKLRLTPLVHGVLREIDAVQVPVRAGRVTIATERMIRLLQRAGVEVHFWTINEPVAMHRLLDLGADGVVTDRADLALGVLRERGFTV
ncbi:MAG: glycerophosphodiester phosphodiesterase family protein [Microbacterium sp.]